VEHEWPLEREVAHTAAGCVVVGVDQDGAAGAAVVWAAAEAARRGEPLLLLGVVTDLPDPGLLEWYDPMSVQDSEDSLRHGLDEVRESVHREQPHLSVRTMAVHGTPSDVLEHASRYASTIVVGRRPQRRWPSRLAAGLSPVPTSVHLMSTSHCPVVVLDGSATPGGPLVVACNGSASSQRAVDLAAQRADADGERLLLVHARETHRREHHATSQGAPWTIDHAADRVRLRHPQVDVRARVVQAVSVDAGLLQCVRGAGLVFVGAPRHGNLAARVWGSRSRSLLVAAEAAVVVVPAPVPAVVPADGPPRAETHDDSLTTSSGR